MESVGLSVRKEASKMRIALITLLLLITAIPTFATESRITALGGMAGFVPDDVDVFGFPTTLSNYRNFAVGEMRAIGTPFALRSGGVNFYCSRFDADVGVYVNRTAPVNFFQQNYNNLQTVNQEHLILVSKNGVAGGIGIGADSWSAMSDPEPVDGTPTDESTSMFSLHGGYEAELSGGVAELGGHFWTGSGEQLFQGDTMKDVEDGGSNIALAARFTKDKGNGVNWVGLLGFQTVSGELKNATADDDVTSLSGMSLLLGGVVQKAVSKRTTAVFGVIPYVMNKVETEVYTDANETTVTNTVTTTAMPLLAFAMETQVWNWFTGWVGVNKTLLKTKNESVTDDDNGTDTEGTNRTAPFAVSLGGSIKVSDNFRIDGVMNNNWLFTGPNFLSGQALNLMNQISIVGTW